MCQVFVSLFAATSPKDLTTDPLVESYELADNHLDFKSFYYPPPNPSRHQLAEFRFYAFCLNFTFMLISLLLSLHHHYQEDYFSHPQTNLLMFLLVKDFITDQVF
jgi:hypothetical protein